MQRHYHMTHTRITERYAARIECLKHTAGNVHNPSGLTLQSPSSVEFDSYS